VDGPATSAFCNRRRHLNDDDDDGDDDAASRELAGVGAVQRTCHNILLSVASDVAAEKHTCAQYYQLI